MIPKYHEAFVYPFATNLGHYLYDVNTNAILKTTSNIYNFYKINDEKILQGKDINILEKMTSEGFLKPNKIQNIEHPVTSILSSYMNRKVQTITLQLTQQCNLRCKYCAYSGNYNTRVHGTKKMSLELAKNAIDFLVKHSLDLDEINIGFYGGEPLLCFNEIKQLVLYAQNRAEGKNISYNITTNGTLFNDENIKFMQENSFMVTISLDGPEEIHDRNRVFASNGKGTYSTIISNIKYIKENYPNFYSQLTFNAVIDPTTDRVCSSNFFINCKEIEGAPLSASIISPIGLKNKIKINEQFFINEDVEDFKLMLNKIGRLSSEKVSKISEARFNQMLATINLMRLRSRDLPEVIHPSGPCIPGARKLMIDVEGSFYPCESVPEVSALRIGNISEGFDLQAISALLNVGKLTEERCKNCWGIRLCTQCCLPAANENGLSKELRLFECNNVLRSHEQSFKDFCTLKEYGYAFSTEIFKLN
ncbi:Cys-rich peptide radical SAM maturase CcpM [Desulfovibrio sp.]|uniref:Cys-rich peptide radical SAM maturase CcpM n=1 Tax=Desulfovibrio sp. TaxID=885 RepID=UPI0025C0213D|nr:Cys-rich peptide radical SAM maturase CcpM [Desulfovibrio sp.]